MGLKLLIASFVISSLLIITGIVLLEVSTPILNSYVASQINLKPGGMLYEQWVEPKVPIYMNFYLYDLKNPTEFQGGAKPVIEEIGPFVYREYIHRDNLVDNGNYTLSYIDRKSYIFEREMSQHDEDFNVTTLNLATVVVYQKVKNSGSFIEGIVANGLKLFGEDLTTTRRARDIIWGYKDGLLAFLKHRLPAGLIPTDTIGFFINQNDSLANLYTIYTGEDDGRRTGLVEKWNHKNTVEIWGDEYGNMINGSDGTIYPALLTKDDQIYIFQDPLCRSVYVNYNGTIKVSHHDIEVMGFTSNKHFYENATLNPDNSPFCSPPGNCLPSGLLNLTDCQQGLPIIMSSPHFLFSPSYLSDAVNITPEFDKHGTILYMEPTSGIMMKANKRIQFNTMLEKDSKFNFLKNVGTIMYPLFWVDENMEVDKDTADQYYSQIGLNIKLIAIGKWVIFCSGVVLFGLSCYYAFKLKDQIRLCFFKRDQADDGEHIITNQAFVSQSPSMKTVENDSNEDSEILSVNGDVPNFDSSKLNLVKND